MSDRNWLDRAVAVLDQRLVTGEAAQQHVEHRREEDAERRDADHAGEHRDAHGVTHLRAGADRCYQRHHAHDEGNRRHQDRPQPQAAGLDCRGDRRAPGKLKFARELHDQNRVLRRQPDQNEQANLGEDVVVVAGDPDPEHCGQKRHRHDHDDRQRQHQAFILRSEHQEHQQHHDREDVERGVAGDDLLIGQVRPLEADALGQRLVGDACDRGLRLAGGIARRVVAVDVRRKEAVIAHRTFGPGGGLQLQQHRKRDHLAGGRAHL